MLLVRVVVCVLLFFFFKQKTAYEMRISDWSSDVCSSDLHEPGEPAFPCKGLVDPSSCPLEGHIDVALLVRPRIAPRPTAVEDGVTCALRAGVPLVEDRKSVV